MAGKGEEAQRVVQASNLTAGGTARPVLKEGIPQSGQLRPSASQSLVVRRRYHFIREKDEDTEPNVI